MKKKRKPYRRVKLFDNVAKKPSTSPIILGFIFILFVFGCNLISFGLLTNWNLISIRIFEWLPEIFLIMFSVFYMFIGLFLKLLKKDLIVVETYRLYGFVSMSIATLLLGIRFVSFKTSFEIIMSFFASIIISVIMMLGIPKKTMEKMEVARAKGWLKETLKEDEWKWNPLYTELEGPEAKKGENTKFKVLEKLHYIAPGIISIFSSIFGNTQTIQMVGLVCLWIGLVFVREVARMSGIVQQLRIWEDEIGKKLTYTS